MPDRKAAAIGSYSTLDPDYKREDPHPTFTMTPFREGHKKADLIAAIVDVAPSPKSSTAKKSSAAGKSLLGRFGAAVKNLLPFLSDEEEGFGSDDFDWVPPPTVSFGACAAGQDFRKLTCG